MTDDTIVCSQCTKELVMKFIELKDLVFCSNQCLDTYITTIIYNTVDQLFEITNWGDYYQSMSDRLKEELNEEKLF